MCDRIAEPPKFMLQTITSIIVIAAAAIQLTGFVALRRYFADLNISAPSALSNFGAIADWGYQTFLDGSNPLALTLALIVCIAILRNVFQSNVRDPLEIVLTFDRSASEADAVSSWLGRLDPRSLIKGTSSVLAAVILCAPFVLMTSAESYADKVAREVITTGSHAQLIPFATAGESARVSLRAPAELPTTISQAIAKHQLVVLWSDEHVVAVGVRRDLGASSPLETDVIDRSAIDTVQTLRSIHGAPALPPNNAARVSLLFGGSAVVFVLGLLIFTLVSEGRLARRRAGFITELQSRISDGGLTLRLRRVDADCVLRAYGENRDVLLTYFSRDELRLKHLPNLHLPPFFWRRHLTSRYYLPRDLVKDGFEMHQQSSDTLEVENRNTKKA